MKPNNIFVPMDMKIPLPDLKNLCATYGHDATLGSLLEAQQKTYPHQCPKCNGLGYTMQEFNTYPNGFPDSGWVDQFETFAIICNVCDGQGFTKHQMIPKPSTEYIKA